ncbi:MAG: hypothetical protein CMF23_08040, partial [Ignavibacteriae bacterium]|nr:hypothetical protein [Ignavibacteriota bacterium]
FDGKFEYSDVVEVEVNNLPTEFVLEQNYPNPFNPSTKIKFSIPNAGQSSSSSYNTKLIVYDILGKEVATLVNQKLLPGNHEVNFDASNLTSGLYIYRIDVEYEFSSIKKMILIK